ncbi:hypothetical protein QBC39DRAFT_169481 [Podospora conica]|nr:hypothetical protein QBC39DRAFT_169481 [Schizothecium conicum]
MTAKHWTTPHPACQLECVTGWSLICIFKLETSCTPREAPLRLSKLVRTILLWGFGKSIPVDQKRENSQTAVRKSQIGFDFQAAEHALSHSAVMFDQPKGSIPPTIPDQDLHLSDLTSRLRLRLRVPPRLAHPLRHHRAEHPGRVSLGVELPGEQQVFWAPHIWQALPGRSRRAEERPSPGQHQGSLWQPDDIYLAAATLGIDLDD